jgi:hypothetical protein
LDLFLAGHLSAATDSPFMGFPWAEAALSGRAQLMTYPALDEPVIPNGMQKLTRTTALVDVWPK